MYGDERCGWVVSIPRAGGSKMEEGIEPNGRGEEARQMDMKIEKRREIDLTAYITAITAT